MKTNTIQKNIPNGWQEKSLGNFLLISKGKLPKKTYEVADENSVPYLSIKHLDDAEFKYAHKSDGVIADKNDLLVIADGSGSGRMYRGYYGLVSSTFLKISSQSPSEISNDYLEVLFSHLDFTKSRFRKGGAIPHFDFKQLKDVDILLPPIKEQQKIAEILGTVDEDIAKTQEVVKATEKLKRGLMQQLFTRGIGHTKFKETKIGQIPERWQLVKMKDICTVRQGLQIAISQRFSEHKEGRYKYITLKSIKENAYDYIESPKQSVICTKNDVLMTRTGNTGVVVTDREGVFHNNFFLIDFDRSRVLKNYLVYYFLREDIKKIVLEKAGTTTIPDLNHDAFYGTDFVIPELNEQKEIAEILSAVDEKISVNKKLKEKLTLLKKGLMQDLLNGAVRTNI